MKIYFVASFLKGFRGGGAISPKLLAGALKKENEICFITAEKISDSSLRTIPIPYSKFIPKRLIMLGHSVLDNLLAAGLKKILRYDPPDLLHVQNAIMLPAVVIASKKFGIPTVFTLRDTPQLSPEYAEELPLGVSWWMSRRANTILEYCKEVDSMIAISNYIRREFVKAGVPKNKITTIYNLPPSWQFMETPKSSRVTLLSLGRIRKVKGFEVLVKAVFLAIKRVKNIRVIIAGRGPYFRDLRRLVKNLKLDEYIKIISAVPYEKVRELYFNSDIVLLLSTFPEPFCRLSLEAMAAGKPLIATKTGGTTEAVEHGVNGLLVPPNDPEKTAEVIIKLVEDEALRKRMGIAGRKILEEKFNPEKSIKKTIKLYKKVVSKHNILR
ncbi:MAG: glycosyltransferase family 4 protein [Candidatus Lokiarchaeia archaeon]